MSTLKEKAPHKTRHNPYRGEVCLEMGDKTITLVPSFHNLVAIEQQTELGLLEVATKMQSNSLPLEKTVEIILCACEPAISHGELQNHIEQKGIATAYEAVAHFLVGAISAGSTQGNSLQASSLQGGKTQRPGKLKPKEKSKPKEM